MEEARKKKEEEKCYMERPRWRGSGRKEGIDGEIYGGGAG